MGLKDRIVKAFFGDVLQREIQKSSKQMVSHVLGLVPSEGIYPDVDFEIFNQTYEQTSWVRAVVGVICKAVTARGYTLVPLRPDANPDHAELLTEFFANCNPNDTFLEILDDITRDEYVFGNAFLEVVYGPDGKPKELWNLEATTVRVKADEHGTIIGYVQCPRYTTAKKVDFDPREVIHFKLGTKGATLYGLSPLISLVLPVTVDRFAQVYNRSFFVNGAKIRGAFIMKDATPEQVERNREYLQAKAKNPDQAHADLVLEGEVEYKQISVNQKDMEFLELREFTRNEILAVYGVPPSKVSIIETGNIGAGTGEHQTQTFYEETILPFQMRVAEKITKHIIRGGFGITDWAFQFNKRAIDEKDQAEIFNIYLQGGVLKPEEVRRIVAPRMPELEKSGRIDLEFVKGKRSRPKPVINATPEQIAIETRFARALDQLFQRIKESIGRRIPTIARERVVPQIEKAALQFSIDKVAVRGVSLRRVQFPETLKRLDDLEVILEVIDEEGISRVLEKYSLEAAAKALKLAAKRNKLQDIDDISMELDELLRGNASTLASHISSSIKDSIRQALIEGLAANEPVQKLQERVAAQLDSFATVNVRPVIDAHGRVLRAGHARDVSRETVAEMIARSEANRAYNEGNLDALDQAGIDRVVFLLSEDACPECRAVSESIPGDKLGKNLSLDEAHNLLPVHPNCRCTFISEV
ncbi:MAG: hypothetical protein KCHDKBKB_01059 [Elusimicrobia bacterium]|nr:hypothetical protein [Elusimicrobiota bacterium]